MRLVFTCGGTAGHINPAIAVANMMRRRYPDCEVLFIGAAGHMEEQLVPKAGYEIRTIPCSGLSRGKDFAALEKNIHALHLAIDAVGACKKILREWKPDVVFGTGGYASFPALQAAHSLKIRTCVHESNALPGITTKLTASFADRVLVAFQEGVPHYRHQERVEVVGMPVREEFIFLDRQQARSRLGLGNELLVVSAFGSLGAKRMNETMAELFALEKQAGFPFRHIHATGKFGWEWMPQLVAQKGVDLQRDTSIEMQEYFFNMPELMAAADVIISRSGAASCNEIGAAGTPAILIPSPNVVANHQEKNARVFSDRDAAVLIVESECTAQLVFDKLQALLNDEPRRMDMRQKLHGLVRLDSAERICDIIEELTAN